eukprot:scaffold13165_cov177-Amphora_coffeaeformis.AAC.2
MSPSQQQQERHPRGLFIPTKPMCARPELVPENHLNGVLGSLTASSSLSVAEHGTVDSCHTMVSMPSSCFETYIASSSSFCGGTESLVKDGMASSGIIVTGESSAAVHSTSIHPERVSHLPLTN